MAEIKKDGWVLLDSDGGNVEVGSTHLSFRDEKFIVTGGIPPHKAGSTGRIFTDQGEFFPGVCDLMWVRI